VAKGQVDEWRGENFQLYGSFAGPPSRPAASEVAATSLLLRWEAPTHLGGSAFEVLGYMILIQYGGEGGFSLLVEDTAEPEPLWIVEGLEPDCWHEFQVRAITAAGAGAPSAASHPVLTDRAPALLHELRTAQTLLGRLRERLQRRTDELFKLASSGTMALGLEGASPDRNASTAVASMSGSEAGAAGAAGAAAAAAAAAAEADPQSLALGDRDGGGGDESSTAGGKPTPSRVSAAVSAHAARKAVQRRRRLVHQIDELKSLLEVQSLRVATLQASQATKDIERREALAEVAGLIDSGEEPPCTGRAEGVTGTSAAGVLSPSSPSAARRPGSPQGARRSPTRRGAHPSWVTAAAHQQRLVDEARQQRFEAYMQRLVAEQDAQGTVVESYAPFERALVQLRLEKAMKQHVIKGDAAEMGAYFNRCVDRARSAETHNVFDRFADWELEQLVLVFGRFDSDLDGVLEFPDFCRIALMVCERVGAAYLEHDLRRMFHKIDLDGDKRIDLNEFLWMQVPAEKLAKVHSRP
jgi:hypothetical protein